MICTSSVAAQDGQIGQVAYSASKRGVAALTLPVAGDLPGDGIRVVTIMPGLFLTPMFGGLSQEAQKSLAASVPFPARLGNPSEYAGLAVYICENPMLNGACIRLDGALRMAPRAPSETRTDPSPPCERPQLEPGPRTCWPHPRPSSCHHRVIGAPN